MERNIEKKKILFVHNSLEIGGIEKSLINLVNSLEPQKYEVELHILSSNNHLATEINSNIKVKFIPNRYKEIMDKINNLKLSYSPYIITKVIRKTLRDFFLFITNHSKKFLFEKKEFPKFDIAISFSQAEAVPMYTLFNIIAHKKYIFYHQGEVKSLNGYQNYYKMFDKVITVSQGVLNLISQEYPSLKHSLTVIHNIIPIEEIKLKSQIMIEDEISKEEITLVSVGRLSREKGFDLAIRAASIMKERKIGKFTWYIIGDGNQKESLEKLINYFDLKNSVKLLGWKENPYPYISNCDIYIQPSRTESYGIAIREAQVLGKVSVATRTIGAKELIDNKVTGILTDFSPEDIALQVMNTLSDLNTKNYIEYNLQSADFKNENSRIIRKLYELF